MDQFVVDLGAGAGRARRRGRVFGDAGDGRADRARTGRIACDTIGYEIVTRVGGRVPRRYLHATATA